MELPDTEVHVFWVSTPDCQSPDLKAQYESLLTPAERARRDRLALADKRHEFLVTRALVRTTLARYVAVAPAAFRFRENPYGRPEIDEPAGARSVRFNLSNTFGLVAIAVTREREIGIDVEDVQRRGETTAVADRFFSPTEVEALLALPESNRRARFFEYWTLKEAYIKARGMGLAIPLRDFSFLLDEHPPIRIAFDLEDDPESWQFEAWNVTARHRLALAIRRGRGPDLALRAERVVPLR